MTQKTVIRTYKYSQYGKPTQHISVTYNVTMDKTGIIDVTNEYGTSIERKSECFDYFTRLFKNGNI